MLDLIKEYAYKRADLLKLEATEKSVTLLGTVIFIMLALFSVLFFVMLLLFGIGFVIGAYLNNYGYGLLIVAVFFFLILIVVFMMRKTIKNRVANIILESIYD
jgi:uncharacterized membrane protein YqjE